MDELWAQAMNVGTPEAFCLFAEDHALPADRFDLAERAWKLALLGDMKWGPAAVGLMLLSVENEDHKAGAGYAELALAALPEHPLGKDEVEALLALVAEQSTGKFLSMTWGEDKAGGAPIAEPTSSALATFLTRIPDLRGAEVVGEIVLSGDLTEELMKTVLTKTSMIRALLGLARPDAGSSKAKRKKKKSKRKQAKKSRKR